MIINAEVFSTDGKFDDKSEVSIRTYEKVFTHLQAYVTAITAMAGILPILIPEHPLGIVHDKRKKVIFKIKRQTPSLFPLSCKKDR